MWTVREVAGTLGRSRRQRRHVVPSHHVHGSIGDRPAPRSQAARHVDDNRSNVRDSARRQPDMVPTRQAGRRRTSTERVLRLEGLQPVPWATSAASSPCCVTAGRFADIQAAGSYGRSTLMVYRLPLMVRAGLGRGGGLLRGGRWCRQARCGIRHDHTIVRSGSDRVRCCARMTGVRRPAWLPCRGRRR